MHSRDEDLTRAVATLSAYVHAPTPSGDAAALEDFVGRYAARLEGLGAATTLHPAAGGPHLVAELPGTGRWAGTAPVLLIGHADTVWPAGTIEDTVPWADRGDVIAGPGTFDMKAGLVTIEEALRATAGADRLPVRIFVAADEEVGSPTSQDVLLAAAAGCRFALGFEGPHADGRFKVGRLGSTRLVLRVRGREAHAAIDPEKGISATDELVDQLVAVRELVERVAAERPGTVLRNLGSITAPGRANVVAAAAEALVGFRFADAAAERAVLGGIEALVPVRPGARIGTERLSHRTSWRAKDADVALAAWVGTLAEALGEPVPGQKPAPGAADTNAVGAGDLPVIDGFGPRGGGAHARSEHIETASLGERIRLLGAVLTVPEPPVAPAG